MAGEAVRIGVRLRPFVAHEAAHPCLKVRLGPGPHLFDLCRAHSWGLGLYTEFRLLRGRLREIIGLIWG